MQIGRRVRATAVCGALATALMALTACDRGADEPAGPVPALNSPWEAPPEPDLSLLTYPYGCGHGFAVGAPAQDVGLFVQNTAAADTLPRHVTVPDPHWDAEVVLGQNLFANWCDDVGEDPWPVYEERWTVVSGTITIHGSLEPSEFHPRVSATLSGFVVEAGDGTRIKLGDIEVFNMNWGYLPG